MAEVTRLSTADADTGHVLEFSDARRLTGLSWAHFLNDGAANYLPGILPAVLVSLHEPVQLAGVLMAALTIGQGLQPVTGWAADRLGGRGLIIAGLLASSLGGALIGTASSIWMLIGVLLVIGTGNSLFHPQALAAVRNLIGVGGARENFLTSAFLVGGELGRGVWPTVASYIEVHLGLRGLLLAAIPALITIPFLFRWAPKLPARKTHGAPIRWREHRRPLAALIGYRSMRALVTYGLVTFVPIMWHIRGGSLVSGASIITAMIVVGVIGNLGGGHVTDRFGRAPVMVISAVATTILTPVMVYANGPWIWLTASLLGIAVFLTASTMVLIGQDIFPENRSMGAGISLGLANAIGALLVLAIGFLVNAHDVVTVFWALAGVGLLSAVLVAAFPRPLLRK